MRGVLEILMVLLFALGAVGCSDSSDSGGDAAPEGEDDPLLSLAHPPDDRLPTVTGTCPDFTDGDTCTGDGNPYRCAFQPEGVADPRDVLIYISDAGRDSDDSALVFFWHGNSGVAENVTFPLAGLGPQVMDAILAAGGIVASPESVPNTAGAGVALDWTAALGIGSEDDFLVMDEVTACLIEHLGIDTRRIHSTGLSAGAMQTGRLTQTRSNYLASVAMFSGAVGGTIESQDPDNLLPAMMFHGGPTDVVPPFQFQKETESARDKLEAAGNMVVFCAHTEGHRVSTGAPEAAWQFMQAHPYRIESPWADGLPEDLAVDYCEI